MILIVDERRPKSSVKEDELLFSDFQYLYDFIRDYEDNYAANCLLVSADGVRKIDRIIIYKKQYERAERLQFYANTIGKLRDILKKYKLDYIE